MLSSIAVKTLFKGSAFGSSLFFCLGLASAFATAAGEARTVTDATGAAVKLATRPARVVTLVPSLGELAADVLGMNLERIVGVSEYTDYPPALRRTASVGPYVRFSMEKVVSLRPDLVLASKDGNSKDQVLHLRELGLPVVVVETGTFDQVAKSMKLVAEALGEPARGENIARQFGTGLERLRNRARDRAAKGVKAPRVLLQVGDDPLVVAGGGTFLNEAVHVVGATNIYADLPTPYPRPSLEDVIARKPDRIIVLALGPNKRTFAEARRKWSTFTMIPAVKSGKVDLLEADALLRPSLRLLEGLALLENRIFDAIQ